MTADRKIPKPLRVIAGAPDKPLLIGEITIPCYVLEDETRVLSQRGMTEGISLSRGGPRAQSYSGNLSGAEIPRFASQIWLRPFISNDLAVALKSPIWFELPARGTAYGYPASVLVDLCNAIINAARSGSTGKRQRKIVQRALDIIQGLSNVGIVALVDEATGYEEVRRKRSLAAILERFIAPDLQPWTQTFPYEFYEQIYRLKGWGGPQGTNRPQVIGHYTNDSVYSRLAPGVLDELRRLNPTLPGGDRRNRHHQWFTQNVGHPKLREHLAAVIALMRISKTWESFKKKLTRAFPRLNEQFPLDFEDDE